MSKIITRNPKFDDVSALRSIWNKIFGSIGEDAFFRHYYNSGLCIVAEDEGVPAAAGYLLPFGHLQCGPDSLPCSMIYSIATLPEHRGKGFGSAVVNELISLAHKLDHPVVVLCPSEDDLFEYYSKRTAFGDWFYAFEQLINEVPACESLFTLNEISVNEYHDMREKLLEGRIHIVHDLPTLEYQAMLSKELGGGLYRIDDACAAIECQPDGSVWIKELLLPSLPGDPSTSDSCYQKTIASIAEHFPAQEYVVRCPAKVGNGRRFGMLAYTKDLEAKMFLIDNYPWYGLAFD